MRKIYLASGSVARKQLLRVLGIKCSILPSGAREGRSLRGQSYEGLVKANALKKAQAAVGRVSSGIVIAADTITVCAGKIYGKPKNLAHARRMLKILSRRPQVMYTGLAVIDIDKDKVRVACEKTKVFMDPLSDGEITRYFAGTSPLDKAGSFDIQGKGACFVRRIEGCFYNVVGLPVRALYRILKKMDVKVLVVLLGILMCGCSTEYNKVTGKQESYYYNTDREVAMGKAMSREAEKQYKLSEDPLLQDRVKRIGTKIAAVCDRRDIDYHFKVLDEDEVNAFSLPGGWVYVNKGLVDKVDTDDELACVIAHEVGHIVARHSIKKLQAVMGYTVLAALATQVPQAGGAVLATTNIAFTQLLLGYSREDEMLADELGTRYAKLAGYNPQAMIDFLIKLQEVNRRRPMHELNYFKTHPYVPDRIRGVKGELGEKMNFTDYINIEEKKQ